MKVWAVCLLAPTALIFAMIVIDLVMDARRIRRQRLREAEWRKVNHRGEY